jgi:DNA-directed RNA polymerase subunit RPC12/RpoP
MIVYNKCSKCGRRIKITTKNPVLAMALEDATNAVCNECEPISRWEVVKEDVKA